jgi:hypothetical protein
MLPAGLQPPRASSGRCQSRSIHKSALDVTSGDSLDSTPNLSWTNNTQEHAVDDDHQPTDVAVGMSSSTAPME